MVEILLLVLRIALVLALYAFIGWALWVLWKDLQQQRKVLVTPQVPAIDLEFRTGDEAQKETFTIPEVTIGRDPRCEFQIQSETVSVRHAQLSYHHGQWWLEDLDSTNGSFLNNERVMTSTVIVSGDQLRCGEISISISIEDK
jgi:pSer/pThr/pTyr-binding forkhead associated (FHA) protein